MSEQTDERPPPALVFGVLTLPRGVATGFVTVTLGFVLSRHGFSVADIAVLVSLHLLPSAWKFVAGPLIDVTFTPRLWFLAAAGLIGAGLAAFAFLPLRPDEAPLLSALAFLLGVAESIAGSAQMAVAAVTTPPSRRGPIGGWIQTGNLGGSGLGGGAGLWLATHGGLPLAALAVAGACLLSAAPMLFIRTPPRPAGVGLGAQALGLAQELWSLARTRPGVLAMVCVVLPVGLGAATSLLPTVAGQWRAGADQVALVTGALAGLAAAPGCLVGGYLCNRFPARAVLMATGLACAFGEAAMAWAPHTPDAFTGFVLANKLLIGLSWGAVPAVILETLSSRATATVAASMSSLTNLPVVVVTIIVGRVQTRAGTDAMLLAEAGLCVAGVAAYALLAWAWKPAVMAPAPSPA